MAGKTGWAPGPGAILGFALGGFFDGILLHQILQWHHLLSALRPEDARFQVAADGYFHALMYGIAAFGLWRLWRAQRQGAAVGGRALLAGLLTGFGLWQIVDILLAHWILGIHRVRLATDSPLFWDLLWLAVFGLAPLAVAWALRRSGGGSRGAGPAMLATLLAVGAAGWSLRPPPGAADTTTVLFAPGRTQAQVMRAVAELDAQLVWMDSSGEMVVLRLPSDTGAFDLYRRGAILVAGAGGFAGCSTFAQT